MRPCTALLILALFGASVAAPADAPPKVNTPEGRAAWEVYSRDLLVRLYPDTLPGARPVVVVDSGPAPSADRSNQSFFTVNFAMIEVFEDIAEYASVLAHEYSHIVRNHEDTRLWSDLLVFAGHDMVLMEKQELEADADALTALRRAGYDPCAAARMLTRFVDGYRMRQRADNPYCAMVIRRESALLRDCPSK